MIVDIASSCGCAFVEFNSEENATRFLYVRYKLARPNSYWTNTRHEQGPQERHPASATVPTETTTMIDGDDNDASSNELKL